MMIMEGQSPCDKIVYKYILLERMIILASKATSDNKNYIVKSLDLNNLRCALAGS